MTVSCTEHFLGVVLADGAADGGVVIQRVPGLHLLGLPHELRHELVEYLPLHKHPRAVRADLGIVKISTYVQGESKKTGISKNFKLL